MGEENSTLEWRIPSSWASVWPWGGQEDEIYETPDARSFELLCADKGAYLIV